MVTINQGVCGASSVAVVDVSRMEEAEDRAKGCRDEAVDGGGVSEEGTALALTRPRPQATPPPGWWKPEVCLCL